MPVLSRLATVGALLPYADGRRPMASAQPADECACLARAPPLIGVTNRQPLCVADAPVGAASTLNPYPPQPCLSIPLPFRYFPPFLLRIYCLSCIFRTISRSTVFILRSLPCCSQADGLALTEPLVAHSLSTHPAWSL